MPGKWRLHVRGAVCSGAKVMVSSLDAATKAAQRVRRTDLDHFLRGRLAVAQAGARRCVWYLLLLLLGGHGRVESSQLFTPRSLVTLENRASRITTASVGAGACQARRLFWGKRPRLLSSRWHCRQSLSVSHLAKTPRRSCFLHATLSLQPPTSTFSRCRSSTPRARPARRADLSSSLSIVFAQP